MQKVLPQLAHGAVRISFGELRQASPPGTFSAENDRDRVMVELPLHEILARVKPGLLARRPAQKQVRGAAGGGWSFWWSDTRRHFGFAAAQARCSSRASSTTQSCGSGTRRTRAGTRKISASSAKGSGAEEPVFKRFNTPAGQPGLVTNASIAAVPAARPQPLRKKKWRREAPISKVQRACGTIIVPTQRRLRSHKCQPASPPAPPFRCHLRCARWLAPLTIGCTGCLLPLQFASSAPPLPGWNPRSWLLHSQPSAPVELSTAAPISALIQTRRQRLHCLIFQAKQVLDDFVGRYYQQSWPEALRRRLIN